MNTSVNELLSNPAFRPLVLLDVLAVFLMIICLVFRRMRKGYYVEQANDARKATMLNIAVRNVTGMGVYSAPGYWDNGDLNLCRFERANGDIVPGVLMIAWGFLCGIPELRSWMLARATDLEHTLEAMWAGLDGDGRMLVYIFALWLMGAIVIMVGGRR